MPVRIAATVTAEDGSIRYWCRSSMKRTASKISSSVSSATPSMRCLQRPRSPSDRCLPRARRPSSRRAAASGRPRLSRATGRAPARARAGSRRCGSRAARSSHRTANPPASPAPPTGSRKVRAAGAVLEDLGRERSAVGGEDERVVEGRQERPTGRARLRPSRAARSRRSRRIPTARPARRGRASPGTSTRRRCAGTWISAGMPSSRATAATALPWLPAEHVTTPRRRSSASRRDITKNAPRILKEPVSCRRLELEGDRERRPSRRAGSDSSIGVRRMRPASARRASRTSAMSRTVTTRFASTIRAARAMSLAIAPDALGQARRVGGRQAGDRRRAAGPRPWRSSRWKTSECLGSAVSVPATASGTMSTPSSIASRKAPSRNGARRAVGAPRAFGEDDDRALVEAGAARMSSIARRALSLSPRASGMSPRAASASRAPGSGTPTPSRGTSSPTAASRGETSAMERWFETKRYGRRASGWTASTTRKFQKGFRRMPRTPALRRMRPIRCRPGSERRVIRRNSPMNGAQRRTMTTLANHQE